MADESPSEKDKVEANLRLYDRQMTHYESTQGIEWKVNVGVWTLFAAAIAWAAANHDAASRIPACGWLIALALAVLMHGRWLWLVHDSQEKDKELWCHYRGHAEKAIPQEIKCHYTKRTRGREAWWLVSEVGFTFAMAAVLWLFVAWPTCRWNECGTRAHRCVELRCDSTNTCESR
jgi:hypothetical protein